MLKRNPNPGMSAFDFLSQLLILFIGLTALTLALVVLLKIQSKPSINTYGSYAVVISWKNGSNDDVDLYVQDPAGNICYFANPSAGLMHLERDDRGTYENGVIDFHGQQILDPRNFERLIIRGIVPGEYTVDVHMYIKNDPGPDVITVQLWKLLGNDHIVYKTKTVLVTNGDEKTAFRFTIDSHGDITNINHLFKSLVGPSPIN